MGGAGLIAPWTEGGRTAYAGQPILVIGGASGTGQSAIQFAKLSGFSPIITTASLSNTELVKSLGATHVIDRSVDLATALAPITATAGPLKHIFDAIGEVETQEASYAVLADGGKLITVGHVPIKAPVPEKEVIEVWGATYIPPNRAFGVVLLEKLTGLLESGEFKPNAVEVLPGGLAGVPDGLDRLKKNQVRAKKLIVRPQETL